MESVKVGTEYTYRQPAIDSPGPIRWVAILWHDKYLKGLQIQNTDSVNVLKHVAKKFGRGAERTENGNSRNGFRVHGI
jgi:hypothetical protein